MSSEKPKKADKSDANTDKDEKKEETKPKDRWNVAIAGNGLAAALGVVEFFLCFTARNSQDDYMNIIEGYDGGNLLSVLGMVGLIAAMVGAYGTVLCVFCKKPVKARRLRYMIYAYFGWGGGVVLLLLVSFGLTFRGSGEVEFVLKRGFGGSLTRYHKEGAVRSAVDYLQKNLHCCGNVNYTDWFTVKFTDKYSVTETAIPGSCCRETPCVEVVENGQTERLTPFKTGCVRVVIGTYERTLYARAMPLVAMAMVEMTSLVVIGLEMKRMLDEAKVDGERKKLLTKSLPPPSKGPTATKDQKSSVVDRKKAGKAESETSEDSEREKKSGLPAAVPVVPTSDTSDPAPAEGSSAKGGGYAPDYSMTYS